MKIDEIYEGFSILFLPWIGMEDFNVEDHQPYNGVNIEDSEWLRHELRIKFVPYLLDLDDASKKTALNFALFAYNNPSEISLEGIFASMLIGLNPPKDRRRFFGTIVEECFSTCVCALKKGTNTIRQI